MLYGTRHVYNKEQRRSACEGGPHAGLTRLIRPCPIIIIIHEPTRTEPNQAICDAWDWDGNTNRILQERLNPGPHGCVVSSDQSQLTRHSLRRSASLAPSFQVAASWPASLCFSSSAKFPFGPNMFLNTVFGKCVGHGLLKAPA